MKLIDLNYHSNKECKVPDEIIDRHRTSLGYVDYLNHNTEVIVVKHINFEGSATIREKQFTFFKRSNRFWQIPSKTHRFIAEQKPDVIIVQGFIFPLQVIKLRKKIGKKPIIILQHRGDVPPTGLRKKLQQMADRHIDKYLFTSISQSEEWIRAGIISSADKCIELQGGSIDFERFDREVAKENTQMTGELNFLWVGRLDNNKDPLTVLKAFNRFCHIHPQAKLHMIYNDDSILPAVDQFISRSEDLSKCVNLIGAVDHNEISQWYSAAEFYVSGSHRESTGYALLEAMCCGCIPVVTDIPSFRKITADGEYGYLYQPGDADGLFDVLQKMMEIDKEEMSLLVRAHFEKELSFRAIAEKLVKLCKTLMKK
ncbi:MAG TPA: glycosyltransferase family 4 protein [Chitinophagaceae bacterium]|nr:glycosyltransferase family 4 protein [Chitinophagaceae bacterium]